jgi:hypothetical protein
MQQKLRKEATMTTKQETQQTLQELKQELATLRDELKLKIHLGTMELKDRWQRLEIRLFNAERQASRLTETSRKAIEELVLDLRSLRRSLLDKN